MKIAKQLLARLMSLNNPEADRQLQDFAMKIKSEIEKSTNNNEIFENLDLLEGFVYKVPTVAVQIIDYLFSHSFPAPIQKTDFGDLEGKTSDEILIKCLGLLDRLRYISTEDVLRLLSCLVTHPSPKVKAKALEILKNLAQYDFTLLSKTNLGYTPQRKVLDFIAAWSPEERLQNFDFINTATERLLSSSVEGLSGSSEAITFNFAAVKPSNELKQIRKEIINFAYNFYKQLSNNEQKLKLLQIFDEAVRTPLHVAYGDDVAAMIAESWKYIVNIYKEILFN
jgi:hypothetical protein